jgi:L-fuconolactonase
MIIDAHVHLWPRWPYQPPVPDDAWRGSYPNLLYEMDAAGVDMAVAVNARIERSDDNDAYGAAAAAAHPDRLLNVVDLDSRWGADYHRRGAADRLGRLVSEHRPVGVSHYLGPENDGWLLSDEAELVVRKAEQFGLFVSLAASPPWFADLRELALRHPTVDFLVNHLGVVMLHPAGIEAGLRLVLAGEQLPNLVVKTSGYYYGSDRPWDYPFSDRMWIARAFFDAWGPERMVWASDWPSLLAHMSYRQSLEVLRERAGFLAGDDLDAVLGGNMARILSRSGRLP